MPTAARALGLAALFGVTAQLLFFGHGPGLNVAIALGSLLTLTWAQRAPGVRIDHRDVWLPVGAVLFAAFCAIRADVVLLALDLFATVALSGATVVMLSGVRVMDLTAARLGAEALGAVGALLVRGASVVAAVWPLVASVMGARASRAGGYAAGLLLAAPFLFIFAGLFSSADAVFSRALRDVFDLRRWLDALGELPGRLMVAAIGTWIVAGAFFRLRTPPQPAPAGPPRGWLGAEPATIALVAIDALFVVFVALQITYLFGGRDTVDAVGITYSAYARRGFFELTGTAAIVGVVLFGAELAIRRRTLMYVGAALALVTLSAIVLVSAAYRLDLYQRAYGWTEQRFYAAAMVTFLAGGLAVLAWSIARARMRFALQPLAMAALVVGIAVNALAPSEFIVRANVTRVLDPDALPADAERRLDVWYLTSLGDGAMAALVEVLPSLPDGERQLLGTRLRQEVEWRARRPQPWQSWNLDRERARRALAGAREELLMYPAR